MTAGLGVDGEGEMFGGGAQSERRRKYGGGLHAS